MKPYFKNAERLSRLQAVSESWQGTPFMPNAAIKGHGVSCQKLVTAIYKETGALPPHFECDDGPMNWSHAQTESLIEKFMAKQSKYFFPLDYPAVVGEPMPGDMLGFKIDGCVHHCGILFATSYFVHCWRSGGVLISNIRDATYSTRLAKIWRPIDRRASIINAVFSPL